MYMKIHKDVERVVRTLVEVRCDLCGERIFSDYETVDEVIIKHRRGVHYPEAAWGHELVIDLCGKCWCEKVLPRLRILGILTPYQKYDW